jgi:microcystin-dependent protein
MFQNLDFSKAGGFPLTQKTMSFVQNSYNKVLEALARSIGNYVIISGVTEISPNVFTNGWITYDNKIVPFAGGNELNFIKLVQTNGSEIFNNGNIYQVSIEYTAVFDGAGGAVFNSFQRLSLTELKTMIDNTYTLAANAYNLALSVSVSAVPAGIITMWSGLIDDIPVGWGLCDGQSGRPDLRGRFIVGYDIGDTDYNIIGNVGGSKSHTLTTSEMPPHNHTISSDGSHSHTLAGGPFAVWIANEADAGSGSSGNEVGGTGYDNTNSAGSHTHSMSNTGGGMAHANRPPYYTLAYIIKI